MTYIKTVTEEELKDFMIEMIVKGHNYDIFAVMHKGKFDLYDEKTEDIQGICYTLCVGSNYWEEEYYNYCRISTEEYTEGLKGYGKKRTEKLIERMREDRNQFRDYMDLAMDHIEIDDKLMEIVF